MYFYTYLALSHTFSHLLSLSQHLSHPKSLPLTFPFHCLLLHLASLRVILASIPSSWKSILDKLSFTTKLPSLSIFILLINFAQGGENLHQENGIIIFTTVEQNECRTVCWKKSFCREKEKVGMKICGCWSSNLNLNTQKRGGREVTNGFRGKWKCSGCWDSFESGLAY